jgi:hypothetical protein
MDEMLRRKREYNKRWREANVAVISQRANSLKNNMSVDEIIRMAEWAKKQC